MEQIQFWQWLLVALAGALAVTSNSMAVSAMVRRRDEPPKDMTRRPDVRHVMGRPWVAAAATTAAVIWALTLNVAPYLQGEWKSTAVVALLPRDPIGTGADTLVLLGPRYIALLDNDRVLQAVGEQMGKTDEEIRAGVSAEIQPGTVNLEIVFAGDDRATAPVANALADIVVEAAADDPIVQGDIVASAVPPRAIELPTLGQIMLFGAAAGVVAAGVVGAAVCRRTG